MAIPIALPLLATTLAGSLPKPSWLAEPEKLWAPWKLEGAALEEGKRDAVRLVLAMQEKAGIDIVSDGEQTRRHFVNGYMEKLEGIDFNNLKTVRIRNRYDANVPRVVGPVSRPAPVHAEDARFLRASTGHRIKFTLPGPMTMVDTLHDEHYGSREKLALAFAAILNQEARELAAAGVDVVQFDEPAFNQVSLECANSRVPIELIALLAGKDVLVGAIDVATARVEQPEDVARVIRSALKHVPKERLFPCTNCGMVPLARDVAAGKLAALGAGAAIVRRELA
jgi:methionine synthase II (cobalamin-independent)